jgi:hypothetical protein
VHVCVCVSVSVPVQVHVCAVHVVQVCTVCVLFVCRCVRVSVCARVSACAPVCVCVSVPPLTCVTRNIGTRHAALHDPGFRFETADQHQSQRQFAFPP